MFPTIGNISKVDQPLNGTARVEPSDARLIPFKGKAPRLGEGCFLADTARLVGDVVIGPRSSIWFGAVIRGDVFHVRIGARVNIQDMALIHVTAEKHPTLVGDDVTIGHRATLHGCTVGRGALIGMGATILDEARIGAHAMVGAGALVTPGSVIEEGTLWTGVPARFRRELRASEREHLARSAPHYCKLAQVYLDAGFGRVGTAT